MEMQNEKNKDNRHKILIILLLLLLILSLCITIWALFFRESAPVLAPDYAPEIESHAEQIDGDNSTKLDAPPGGGAVSLTYSKDVSVDLSNKRVSLMFANPSKSTADMVLQIVIKDTVIVQSGSSPAIRSQPLTCWMVQRISSQQAAMTENLSYCITISKAAKKQWSIQKSRLL